MKKKQGGKKQSNDTYPLTHKHLIYKKILCGDKTSGNLKERMQLDEEVARYIYIRKSQSSIGTQQSSKMIALVI